MKKLYILSVVLLLANFAAADEGLATLTARGAKHVAHATAKVGKKIGHGAKWLISDGSGPIQTCRPGTNCDPVV